jgi:carboxymethylenebutenolidase
MEELRARPECGGSIAVVGYCFGGEFAYLAVTRLGAAAGVAFHGVGIGKHLDEAGNVKRPLSLHFGEDDRFVPLEEVAAIEEAHRGVRGFESYRYPGAKHGFAQADVPAYDEGAARLAEERALTMLARLA